MRESKYGGGGGIRTHEGLRPNSFQDYRIQPLCHPSAVQYTEIASFIYRRGAAGHGVEGRQENAADGHHPQARALARRAAKLPTNGRSCGDCSLARRGIAPRSRRRARIQGRRDSAGWLRPRDYCCHGRVRSRSVRARGLPTMLRRSAPVRVHPGFVALTFASAKAPPAPLDVALIRFAPAPEAPPTRARGRNRAALVSDSAQSADDRSYMSISSGPPEPTEHPQYTPRSPRSVPGRSAEVPGNAVLQSMVQLSVDAIVAIDAAHRIILFNQGAERCFGYSASEMLGQRLDILLPQSSVAAHARHVDAFHEAPEASRHMSTRRTVRGRRRDGSEFPAEATITRFLVNGEMIFTATVRDASERRLRENTLTRLAFYDHLTGLPNRGLFAQQIETVCSQARGSGSHVGVLLLDLDYFKAVNDSLGHPFGDALLVATSQHLQSRIGRGNTLYRFGGDEFVVLMENPIGRRAASNLARRLVRAFQHALLVHGQPIKLSVSIGAAIADPRHTEPHDLVKVADDALYRAKRRGRNCYATTTLGPYVSSAGQMSDLDGPLRRIA